MNEAREALPSYIPFQVLLVPFSSSSSSSSAVKIPLPSSATITRSVVCRKEREEEGIGQLRLKVRKKI